MIPGLDHLVVLARDLGATVADYEEAGFRVTPGGEHADGLTRNALVPFADGTYLEIVEFIDPSDPRDNIWGWRAFLPRGGGLVDYCALSDDLASDARRLREAGLDVDGPDEGGRRLPSGEEIRWKTARVWQEGRVLPFLIEDLTPRGTRVPGGPAAEHPNGATGIRRLHIAVQDVPDAADSLAVLAGGEAAEDRLRLGPHELALSAPGDPGGAAERLDSLGPGPFALDLTTAQPSQRADTNHIGGVRMSFEPAGG